MKKQSLAALAAIVLFLSFAPSAWSVPMFARMYSYNCTMCHYPGYGQLNKFGYNFRAAGYRIPADIGKDMNGGKYDFTNYITARFSAGGSVKTTVLASGAATPDNGSFTLGGASLYVGGGISKNFFGYSEIGLGNGTGIFSGTAPTFADLKMGFVTGTENEFFTARIGKFGADGFGASDRGPVGNSTIAGTVRPTGTGLELGYTHEDTRVTLGFFNGIQNPQLTGLVNTAGSGGSSGKPVTTSSLQAPASDSNNAKDLQLFVNQFIGDDGLAVNAVFYNGYNASVGATAAAGGTNDVSGQEYFNAGFFVSSPIVKKLDIKVGVQVGQTNTGVFTAAGPVGPTSGGFSGEVDYEMDDITPIAFRVDYTTSDFNTKYTDTQKYTLGALTPFVEQVYMNPTITLTRSNAGLVNGTESYNNAYALTDSLFVFF